MTAAPTDGLLRLDSATVPEIAARAVLEGAAVAAVPVAALDVSGPGALDCLQGLLTCDLVVPGDGAFVYGAVLTRFGMIVTDLWATRRDPGSLVVTVPARGREHLEEVFRRALPPRLAQVREGPGATLRIVGPRAAEAARAAGLALPNPGLAATTDFGNATVDVACPVPGAPFAVQVQGPAADLDRLRKALHRAGAAMVEPSAFEFARVLAGWPALAYEIGDKTLPQEVRYDEIGGVSYTKGCYVGQETVARVHFRGHPNRLLQGLLFSSEPHGSSEVVVAGKSAGRVTAVVRMPRNGRWIGLGILRRLVEPGDSVLAAGVEATVVPLPFAPELA